MEPPRQLDALAEDDVQVLRKTLLDVVPLAEDRDADAIAGAVRSQLERLNPELEPDQRAGIESLAQILSDPDWILPPSTRRYVAAALLCFGEADPLPAATASVLKQYAPGVLPGLLIVELHREIEGYLCFRAFRDKLRARRWPGSRDLEQRLLQKRRKLRFRIQGGGRLSRPRL